MSYILDIMSVKEWGIKRLIYRFWNEDLEDVKERIRDYTFVRQDFVNDIVGLRRSGKTYLMFYIVKLFEKEFGREQFIYINCEHRSIYPLKLEDLNYIIEFIHQEDLLKKKVFLLLDEVQAVKGWEVFVKSVYDEFKGKVKIIVSGSVKSLLSREYGRLLSGRHLTIRNFPLSIHEFLEFKGVKGIYPITEESEAKIKKFVEEFIKFGGLPKFVLSREIEYVEETLNDIIERDIKGRIDLRKKEVIDDLVLLLSERVSSYVSFTKLRNILRGKGYTISTDLIIKYTSLFSDVFLYHFLPIFSPKYSSTVKSSKKVYIADNGFISIFPLKISENLGKLMENTVFTELLKRGLEPSKDIFYFKDHQQNEVDFVIRKGSLIEQLVQVTFASGKDEVDKREINSLVKASYVLKCDNLLIITWDCEDRVEVEGKRISMVPIWKWLLATTT
ncbi:MAG: ATP-binding protein [Nitrososphaeria archaeon]